MSRHTGLRKHAWIEAFASEIEPRSCATFRHLRLSISSRVREQVTWPNLAKSPISISTHQCLQMSLIRGGKLSWRSSVLLKVAQFQIVCPQMLEGHCSDTCSESSIEIESGSPQSALFRTRGCSHLFRSSHLYFQRSWNSYFVHVTKRSNAYDPDLLPWFLL